MTITVFGSANIDVTAYVPQRPGPGETAHATHGGVSLGGKGANQAVAAARIGRGELRFVAAIGSDAFGRTVCDDLDRYGVPTSLLVHRDDAATGIALIHVDGDGQNTITVLGGANMSWPDSGPDPDIFADTHIAVFQLETPVRATLAAMAEARARGARVILDPAPAPHADHVAELLSSCEIVTPNETECAALIGCRPGTLAEAEESARMLLAHGPRLAIVKLGDRGLAYAVAGGPSGTVLPFRIDAMDSVAAGDSFCGALAVALDEGVDVAPALRFAAAAGALSAARPGAAASIPDRAEIDDFLMHGIQGIRSGPSR